MRNYGFNTSLTLGINARFVHFLDAGDAVSYGHYQRANAACDAHASVNPIFGVLRLFCGVIRFQLQRRAFKVVAPILDYAIVPLIDRLGAAAFDGPNLRRIASLKQLELLAAPQRCYG